MAAVTALTAVQPKCAIRAGQLAGVSQPARGAGAGAVGGAAGRPVGTGAALIAVQAPRPAGTWQGAVKALPPFLADAGAIYWGAGATVVTATDGRAVGAVGPCCTGDRTDLSHEAWGTGAAPSDAVAVGAVLAGAGQLAAITIVASRTGLIAVVARPAWLAGAGSSYWVAADGVAGITGAGQGTAWAVQALRAQPLLAAWAFVARFTLTGACAGRTLAPVVAVTAL